MPATDGTIANLIFGIACLQSPAPGPGHGLRVMVEDENLIRAFPEKQPEYEDGLDLMEHGWEHGETGLEWRLRLGQSELFIPTDPLSLAAGHCESDRAEREIAELHASY